MGRYIKTYWLIIWKTKVFELPLIVRGKDLDQTAQLLQIAVPDSNVERLFQYWSEDIEDAWLRIETIQENNIEAWNAKRDWWNSHILKIGKPMIVKGKRKEKQKRGKY